MDGYHDDSIRYASDEDRRKAESLVASLDAAEAELEQEGPVSAQTVGRMMQELEQEWALRDAARRSAR